MNMLIYLFAFILIYNYVCLCGFIPYWAKLKNEYVMLNGTLRAQIPPLYSNFFNNDKAHYASDNTESSQEVDSYGAISTGAILRCYEKIDIMPRIYLLYQDFICYKPFESIVIHFNETNERTEGIEIKKLLFCCHDLPGTIEKPGTLKIDYTYEIEPYIPIKKKSHQVLVCVDDNSENDIIENLDVHPLKLLVTTECEMTTEGLDQQLVAVITPEPFETDMSVPLITYIIPPIQLNLASDDNVIPLRISDPSKTYGIALTRFFEIIGWQRVAILSDNYENSVQMESDLLTLFNEHRLPYTVVRCEEGIKENCNFKRALNTLKNVEARITVVNVDERNIQTLQNQVQEASFSYRHAWIFVNWATRKSADKFIGDVIHISLSPSLEGIHTPQIFNTRKMSEMSRSIIEPVLESVRQLEEACHDLLVENDETVSYRTIHRQLINKLRPRKSSKTQVYIKHRDVNHKENIIASMLIDDFKIKKEEFFTPKYITADLHDCLVRGTNYFKPCNDFELILLMFIIIVFTITYMSIIVYFSDIKSMQARRRYRNL